MRPSGFLRKVPGLSPKGATCAWKSGVGRSALAATSMNHCDEKHRSPNRNMPEPLTFGARTRRNFLSFDQGSEGAECDHPVLRVQPNADEHLVLFVGDGEA